MRIKRLNDLATVPTRGSIEAAGWDLYAAISEAVVIAPHKTVFIDTGWAMEIPAGHYGAIYARSGLASKQGLRPANCVGVVDSDYRGPVMVALHNDSEEARVIDPNERIAQLIIAPYSSVTFEEVEELDETIRGEGGFGSTDK